MSYFPEPHVHCKSEIEVELDLTNYARKSNLKNAKGVDISEFAKKTVLANLKSEIDRIRY